MRSNTPTKRKGTSKVWETIRRLREGHKNFNTHTHICHESIEVEPGVFALCNYLLKLHKVSTPQVPKAFMLKSDNKKEHPSWSTSGAVDHLKTHEKNDVGFKSSQKESMREAKRLDDIFDYTRGATIVQQNAAGVATATIPTNRFAMSTKDQALTAQAEFFVFGNTAVSFNTFENEYWKEMLTAQYQFGVNVAQHQHGAQHQKTGNPALLSIDQLKKFITAEFDMMIIHIKYLLALKVEQSCGNTFAQAIHDGGTLTNKKKYQAFGCQFMDPQWDRNFVVAIGFVATADSTAETVANAFSTTFEVRFDFDFNTIFGSSIQDRAALSVSNALGMEEQHACLMHDGDKIAKSAYGGLIRTRMKVDVNPFKQGTDLVTLMHNMGKHFSYSQRLKELHKLSDSMPNAEKQAKLSIQLDLNTTRVASVHSLLQSEIRMMPALIAYDCVHSMSWNVNWSAALEFEAVLNVSRITTTLAQYEHLFNGAYGNLISGLTLNSYRSNALSVIDIKNMTASPHLPRVERKNEDLTEAGKVLITWGSYKN